MGLRSWKYHKIAILSNFTIGFVIIIQLLIKLNSIQNRFLKCRSLPIASCSSIYISVGSRWYKCSSFWSITFIFHLTNHKFQLCFALQHPKPYIIHELSNLYDIGNAVLVP